MHTVKQCRYVGAFNSPLLNISFEKFLQFKQVMNILFCMYQTEAQLHLSTHFQEINNDTALFLTFMLYFKSIQGVGIHFFKIGGP